MGYGSPVFFFPQESAHRKLMTPSEHSILFVCSVKIQFLFVNEKCNWLPLSLDLLIKLASLLVGILAY